MVPTGALVAPVSLGSMPITINVKRHINLRHKKTFYNQNNGTSTDIKNNALLIVFMFGRDDNTVVNPPVASLYTRLKFQDC